MNEFLKAFDFDVLQNIGLSITKIIVIMFLMICLDTFLGVTRAKFVKKIFSSDKLKKGMWKYCLYIASVLLSLLITWWLPTVTMWNVGLGENTITINLVQGIIVVVILIESSSIVENIKEIPALYNVLNNVIEKIKNIFDNKNN